MNKLYRNRLALLSSAALLLLSVAFIAPQAMASPNWTAAGVRLNTTMNADGSVCVADGAGGAIFAWSDTGAVFAQRISSSGVKLWGSNGKVVRSSGGSIPGGSSEVRIVSNGGGGAIIVWNDSRYPDHYIYMQNMGSNGVAMFPVGGKSVGNAMTSIAAEPDVLADSGGGVWVAWVADNGGGADNCVVNYMEDDGSPAVLGGFTIGGSANLETPSIDTDCAGGAIVSWFDQTATDVWANRATQAGVAAWNGSTGIPVCTAPQTQYMSQTVSDGRGGAIILWVDGRAGFPINNIYANHLDSSGTRIWASGGKQVTSRNDCNWLRAVGDGEGGAVAVYLDGMASGPVGANRVTINGDLPWSGTLGTEVSSGPAECAPGGYLVAAQTYGGTVVAWQDTRSGHAIYAQKLDPAGCQVWGVNGEKVADGAIVYDDISSDGAGGAIVSWNISSGGTDLPYGQKMGDEKDTWYLAEGTTGWGFNDTMTIENPNTAPVTVRMTYMPTGSAAVAEDLTVPAASQYTVTNDHLLSVMGGQNDFSTKAVCLQGKTIAVDRTMSWGVSDEGEAHSAVGVTYPARKWFMPEGSTNWGFECWVLVQNPGTVPATCELTYMIEGAAPVTVVKEVPASSRASFNVANDIGNRDASIEVQSNVPVIAERAMYRDGRQEGHESIGTTSPALAYFLAEGSTAWGFTNYVLVQNPNDRAVDVTVTYMTPDGDMPQPPFSMPASSRKTIRVNDVLPGKDVSTKVEGSLPIIAERAMYWSAADGKPACHDSIGMSQPHRTFYLPDGQADPGTETWTLVQNPNPVQVTVEIAYLTPDGTGNVVFDQVIPAGSRMTFKMADRIGGRAAVRVRCLTAGRKVMVERAMYRGERHSGTDTIGGYTD